MQKFIIATGRGSKGEVPSQL